ncbi:MAG: bifunctional glutamate N-acetyltransferase/amino-acid acetyltransferase ArgJ [Candidatus Margulisbacteria bacterium]|nr:bifunctional glutamate N-acetyltransferase/amino-acid acetyltransferase ArgJ [Candidatus Margulisiibacteriota bacterium]
MKTIKGFKFAGIHCGIKKEKKDLGLIYCEKGATCVGVFTKNKFASPTISSAKQILNKNSNKLNAVIVNSGNANCLTGAEGLKNINTVLDSLNSELKLNENSSLNLSTGIIGRPLPITPIKNGMNKLVAELSENVDDFIKAIMTTDTFEKIASKTVLVDGQKINVLGVTKGSGMIQPNMATMLAFIMTDATVDAKTLQETLNYAVNSSFNAITVDSDSSTNDTCLLLASNAGVKINNSNLAIFKDAIQEVSVELAKLIIRDGEGATKFITIKINNASNEQEAKNIFYAIANSPLVKTAIFGENPNFGRILSSAGKINSNIDPDKTTLWLGEYLLYENGSITNQEKQVLDKYMKNKEINITLDLHLGNSCVTGWTSDLSHDYVDINADYN